MVDLHAIEFDPVLRDRDWPNWIDTTIPADQLERLDLKRLIEESAGGPLRRLMVKMRLRNEDPKAIIRLMQEHRPKDVAIQQGGRSERAGRGAVPDVAGPHESRADVAPEFAEN